MGFDRAVLFQPDAGRCRADDTLRALQDRAAAHGASIHFATGPATVHEEGGGVVARCLYADLEVEARAAVVTAGAWLAGTARAGRSAPAVRHRGAARPLPAASTPASGRASSTTRSGSGTGWPRRARASRSAGTTRGPRSTRTRRSVDPAYARGCGVRYAERWLPGVVPEPRARARPACTRRRPTAASCSTGPARSSSAQPARATASSSSRSSAASWPT